MIHLESRPMFDEYSTLVFDLYTLYKSRPQNLSLEDGKNVEVSLESSSRF